MLTKRRRLLVSVAIVGCVLSCFQYAVSAGVGITSRVDAALQGLPLLGPRPPLAQGGGQAVAAATGSGDGIWETPAADAVRTATRLPAGAAEGVVVRLNKGTLDQFLDRAPMEDTTVRPGDQVILSLPLPDGRFGRFRIEESPMLAPELQAAFPEIRTYRAAGVDDLTATARFGWTAAGFHAIILAAGGSVYIDPAANGDIQNYVSLNKADLPRASDFVCLVNDVSARTDASPLVLPLNNGVTRRTYRLALAATAEYTTAAGGTVALALARMTATMNRVNGIYERELAVRLTMATGTAASPTALIFLNGATDGYTNNDGFAMLGENQTKLDAVIGSGGYDIGHVFSTGGGGVASTPSVCSIANKGRGVTGSSNPTGDAFDVDYVAHEMGHQFGGNHTFNATTSNCGGGNRSAAHAYEPGSGSTIMPYAGICGAEDLQRNSHDYFNVESLNEITTYLAGGGACAVTAATGNTVPTVTTPAAFTIPRQTPFTLTATGSDANGDALTYTWEQYDLGGATTSPATIGTDDGSRPLFRSYSPTTSNTRTFPSLPFIRNNANVPPQTYTGASVVSPVVCSFGTCATGEVLPSTNRVMHFHVTARDNRAGGGGIRSAQTSITVTTAAGPFQVTAPNTAVKWKANTTKTVTWNVAGSSAAPVSAANVKISLSTDSGLTFPTVILASTPNDGTEDIALPNLPSTTARIKIEAVNNIFFDMSDVDFEVEPGAPAAPNLTVAVTGMTSVRLSWASTPGATSYSIKRSTAPGGETALTSTAATFLVDSTLSSNSTYYYVVSAFISASEGPNSNEVSATPGRAVVSDFTGDFHADLGTFNPKTGTWVVTGLANQIWGAPGDILVPADYLGAGKVQAAVFRPSNGTWYVKGGPIVAWGQAGDIPVPGDYGGTGHAQFAVFRPSNGYWFVNGGTIVQWGVPGDIPVPGDYNGDGKVDIAVFRPSNGYWYVLNIVSQPWGQAGDIPVPADYNGDGKTDLAVYRPSTIAGGPWWFVRGIGSWTIGSVGDQPVPQDLDGDGRAELSVYRAVSGTYYSYSWSTNTWQTAAAAIGQVPLALPLALRKGIAGDVDRDRRRDPAIYRPSGGTWYSLNSGGGYTSVAWGLSTDVPVAGDYDGDGVLDFAIYRPSDARWWILFSSTGYSTSQTVTWGNSTDVPVAGDVDGDGRSDTIVYRPSNGTWWALLSSTGYAAYRTWSWGLSTDVPVSGDFDGDGQMDITVYRPSDGTWWSLLSSTGYATYRSWSWGASGDQPVVGDYDGDRVNDIAVYRPSDGTWRILLSSSGFTSSRTLGWGGGSGYTVVPGDYDGDGKTDLGLWTSGTWWVLQSSSDYTTWATFAWGISGDIPVPR